MLRRLRGWILLLAAGPGPREQLIGREEAGRHFCCLLHRDLLPVHLLMERLELFETFGRPRDPGETYLDHTGATWES